MPDDRQMLDALRRKLGFCAWNRSTREADLLLG
jgi:succinate dehydrogenase flavin-adding protein (antitoxin of CptAB toxin-antitoxin module)